MSQWQRLEGFLGAGERACRIAIADVEGSSPRAVGAAMLVTSGGGFTGTIGGGALEWQALALGQQLLTDNPEGKGIQRAFSLGPELGQCCGGRVTLLFEAFANADLGWIAKLAAAEAQGSFATIATLDHRGIFLRKLSAEDPALEILADPKVLHEQHGETRMPLLLFGAGHVGRALVLALAPLPFSVRWIDARPDAFPGHHPANVTPVFTHQPLHEIAAARPGTLLLAMTHSHALDLDLVAAGLANPAMAFVGVIGSATKRARFVARLRALGQTEAAIARMVCPIGSTTLAGKEPAVIAAGAAVQMLEARERHLRSALPNRQPRTKQPRLRLAGRVMPPA
jgi:xanthine dehydrogenase accessory factor